MFENYLIRNLKEGEEVIAIVRPFWLTMGFPLFLAGLLIVIDVFLFAWLVQFGGWGLFGFFLVLLLGALWAIRSWIVWSLNAFILTNERLVDVDQKGFFHRTVSEATLSKIQDVSFSVGGPWQTMFQYGNVIVQTAGAKNNLELEGVHHPEQVQELVTKLQQTVQQEMHNEDDLTASELLAMVQKIKKGMTSGKLHKILDAEHEAAENGKTEALEDFLENENETGAPIDLRKRRKEK
ncbi:MAG: PH domain-containing protein [Patescibacteria group bacterium]|jgi:membrane protein YdbS with pleckstrin-like domain